MIDSLPLTQVGLSLAAGGLTTLSPCVFPMLPLIAGGAVQRNRLAPLAMGAGMALMFTAVGLLLGALGPVLGIYSENVRQLGGVALIVFAVLMWWPALGGRFSQWMTPIADSANQASSRLNAGSLTGAFLLGGLLGLIWSPCSGPLLGSALTLVASEGGALRGAIILGLFGIGAATPLVAVAYLSRGAVARARGWVLGRGEIVKKTFAVLLGLTGVAVLTGADKLLEAFVLDYLPDSWIGLTILI